MQSGREVWVERVAGWRRSGLTAKEYARSIGVKWGTLAHWAWRLSKVERPQHRKRKRPVATKEAPLALIEVVGRRDADDRRFELQLTGGGRLHIPADFDAPALRRLLDVLESAR